MKQDNKKLENIIISSPKNSPRHRNLSNNSNEINDFIKKKILYYKDLIQKTIPYTQKYKTLDIYGANDLNLCITSLSDIYDNLNKYLEVIENFKQGDNNEEIFNEIQNINNELSSLFKIFGTADFIDMVNIIFGDKFLDNCKNENNKDIYDIIQKHVHPIGYKIMTWKNENKPSNKDVVLAKNRIIEDFMIVESSKDFDCFDLARTSKNFQTKVSGIKVVLQNNSQKKTLIICGVVDDILINCYDHKFLINKNNNLIENRPQEPEFQGNQFLRFIKSLTLKEFLVYNNDEIYNKYMGYISQINLMKQKTISQIVKEFIANDLYTQRLNLIHLLLKDDNPEFQYLAYLLYDLRSNDNNGTIDSTEQSLLYDSLPWIIKQYFREAMKMTVNYTKTLTNFDESKIPFEQQICLLKVSDHVKEKAMTKLKEIKAKSEDTGSKARQYLDGLLKIPFGIFREEDILKEMKDLKFNFKQCIKKLHESEIFNEIPLQDDYSSLEISIHLNKIKNMNIDDVIVKRKNKIINFYLKGRREQLKANVLYCNNSIKKFRIKRKKLCHSGKKSDFMKNELINYIEYIYSLNNYENIFEYLENRIYCNKTNNLINNNFSNDFDEIQKKWLNINDNILKSRDVLENAVHGHESAKRQIERIIGQWINGEQTGYCFGFEGPPGLGKTTLAKKGISCCLKDKEGNERPFSFIAMGGSSNGSTLEGHNYTYVGSNWGKIVDVLIETKCMNPIIFIDELDKISRTEHGREIIGILTHLVDPTQNSTFQDKYFSGVDLDLSKTLFIFSYNDVELIDRILLDRIHRIKFENLSLEEKLVISNKFILPEILNKMGLLNCINFTEDNLKFIINNYTLEPGVRKLKQILFEIISEINLEILAQKNNFDYPITFDNTLLKTKYLKERNQVRIKEIPYEPKVGIMNGLWANAMGQGGIIPIEISFYPVQNILDLKLTGMQGDVMKESMNVAKTLAWQLTTDKRKKELVEYFKETNNQGLHIHCPEGAVPKDGPSAGTAITVALYSLFNNKKINNKLAITGEINLQGKVTAIGGLDLKILGGIRAGVKTFLFPKENDKEFNKFWEKYKDNIILEKIEFKQVDNINEVLNLVYI